MPEEMPQEEEEVVAEEEDEGEIIELKVNEYIETIGNYDRLNKMTLIG